MRHKDQWRCRRTLARARFRVTSVVLTWLASFYLSVGSLALYCEAQIARAVGPRHRRALLVGNSEYKGAGKKEPKWWRLYCSDEVDRLKEVLVKFHRFDASEVVVLKDATKAQIIQTFETHLIEKAFAGDVVYFHFSGHGQRIADPTGRKLSGLRQSLVPMDYISRSADDGAKRNIRSDEMNRLLHQLKSRMKGKDGKLSGNITITLDACFSGSGTRGIGQRGLGWDPQTDGPAPLPAPGANDPDDAFYPHEEAFAEGYVALSACRSDQVARQMTNDLGERGGIFTNFLIKDLAREPGNITYRALWDSLRDQVQAENPSQSPQIEGDADKRIFDDVVMPVAHYIPVEADPDRQPDALSLPVGSLQDVTVGSRYGIYPEGADVADPRRRIAEAAVIEVGALRCRARLAESYRGQIGEDSLRHARATEIAHVYSGSFLRVFLDKTAIRLNSLKDINVFSYDHVDDDNYDVRVDESPAGGFRVVRKDGVDVAVIEDNARASDTLRDVLLGVWRYRFVSLLHNKLRQDQVEIEVIPVIPTNFNKDHEVTETRDRGNVPIEGGRIQFRTGDFVMIRLRNRAEKPLFVTVLDLMPNGSIGPIYPHPKAMGREAPVPADGSWHRIGLPFVFELGEPTGTEMYKVIATSEPSDFSGLVTSDLNGDAVDRTIRSYRGVSNPIGLLLRSVKTGRWQVGSRGIPPADWATAEVRFTVSPADRPSNPAALGPFP